MYQVISCEKHMIDIIEKQITDCRVLFEGSYTECEQYRISLIEDYGFTGPVWNNTKKLENA